MKRMNSIVSAYLCGAFSVTSHEIKGPAFPSVDL
jgi:hypothetical protein